MVEDPSRQAVRRLVALTITAAVLAGCGSTVQQTTSYGSGGDVPGEGGAGQASAQPLSVPGQAIAPGAVTGEPTTHAAAPLGPGSGGSAGPGTWGAVATSSLSPAPLPVTGPGWDAKTVNIGVITEKDTQQAYATAGAKGIDPGNTEAQAQAMANDLNAHGGIFGRTVKVHFYDVHTIETNNNPDAVGQQACTYFTQDSRVIAVWNVNTQIDQAPGFRSCLARSGVILFTAALRAIDDTVMRSLAPSYVHTLMVSWDALAPVLVRRLKAQGWFGGWNTTFGQADASRAKIGILIASTPEGKRAGTALSRALTAAGYASPLTYQYGNPAEGQAASVQYFHGNGVTHVVITDAESAAFEIAAQSQAYYPRYSLTSYNAPYENLEASGLAPARSNRGAMGVGWVPNLDVSSTNDPGTTPGGKRCLQAMAKSAETFQGKRLAQVLAYSGCDAFTLIARGAAAGGGLTSRAIYDGIFRLGTSFSPANGFATALSPRQPYVQGVVRDLVWNDSCSCMKYGATTTRL